MPAREQILTKIRAGLVQGKNSNSRSDVEARLSAPQTNTIPARGNAGQGQRIDLFCEEAEKVNATTVRINHFDDVPDSVSAYLRDHQLPAKVKLAPDARLTGLPWTAATSLMVDQGAADGSDPVSVSMAFGGVAETGTLVLASGRESPTSLNFLPLDHIVVVRAEDIAGDYEAVWQRLREKAVADGKPGTLPRTVNWVTGPSRTADIEQTLLLGAHGPQRLHIIIVDETSSA